MQQEHNILMQQNRELRESLDKAELEIKRAERQTLNAVRKAAATQNSGSPNVLSFKHRVLYILFFYFILFGLDLTNIVFVCCIIVVCI